MEKSHKIALLSAGLLIGAQVGATVLTTETIPDAASSQPLAAEAEAPDTATPAEVAEVTTTPEVAPEPLAIAEQPILPVSPRHIQYDSLPSLVEGQPMLPSLAAYLDQTEHLRVTGAPGNVFPPGVDEAPMLPSVAAYLDRREIPLIAQTQPPVGSEPSPAVAMAAPSLEPREIAAIEASPR